MAIPPPRSTRVETSRLVLRPSEPDDALRAFELLSDWSVARNLSAVDFPPPDQRPWFGGHPHEWTAGAAYRFAVLLNGEMIGLTDLDHVTSVQAELGYWFGVPSWGRGYATEAAGALVEFARDTLGLSALVAGRAEDNLASDRVLTKLGFERSGQAEVYSQPRQSSIVSIKYVRKLPT
ncbi:MAG TPA: GNAT family N-acetyltransferase [Caulobacteraceae bacterium]